MARRFFYVCAGMLILSIAFSIGATTASGQLTIAASEVGGSNTYALVIGRTAYILSGGGSAFAIPGIPGTARVIAVGAISPAGEGLGVVLENGDCYYHGDPFDSSAPRTWNFQGNLMGGVPTPAVRESWGQVKARYRTPAGGSVTPGGESR